MTHLWQDLLVWLVIGGCVAHLARRMWRAGAASRTSTGCGGGCTQCPSRVETLVTLSADGARPVQESPRKHASV